jgi:hypothetical protein
MASHRITVLTLVVKYHAWHLTTMHSLTRKHHQEHISSVALAAADQMVGLTPECRALKTHVHHHCGTAHYSLVPFVLNNHQLHIPTTCLALQDKGRGPT